MSPRTLTVDLETAPMLVYTWGLFDQNIGINQIVSPVRVISWAAKWHDSKSVMFASEFHDGREEMVKKIYDLINDSAVVIHYNGTSFDMPHLRREFVLAGYEPAKPVQEIDLYRVVKNRFKFPSNKLDFVAQQLGVGGKTAHSGFDLWRRCMDKDEAAWRTMRSYNCNDVIITEKVYDALRPYIKNHPHVGLLNGTDGDTCSRCGSPDLEKRGFAYTSLACYQQYKCRGCGSWSRGKQTVASVGARGIA